MVHLREIFTTPDDLLGLEPEELAAVLMEVLPGLGQWAGFQIMEVTEQLYSPAHGGYPEWPRAKRDAVEMAVAETISWLVTQGLIVRNPGQSGEFYLLTRRGQSIKTRADVEAYRKGRVLPLELLQPRLAEKVHHLFVRGDHDTAVFQAFKEVEVAVRKACGWDDDILGVTLMRKAFHTEDGPLTDTTKVVAEREAEVALFAGAVGHAKNPASHRNVGLKRETAARLIVFASHLLDIVEGRALLVD